MAMEVFSSVSEGIFQLKQKVWNMQAPEEGIAFGKSLGTLRGKISLSLSLSLPLSL